MNSVFFIALRRLRAPLILIILIFGLATAGLTLIPGVDPDGKPWRMSILQAFYFVTYTATTIGFGEIPYPFTDVQRLWVTGFIYLAVIGWAYLLSALLGLAQDQGFQQSIVTARFRRGVKALREPFYVICGFGETGLMVVRSLDRLGFRFVVLDTDPARLHELELQELSVDSLGLAADARLPETLVAAGILKEECRGILALSNHDRINLSIALAAHLLHPGLPILCRSHSPSVTATMRTVTDCLVIDPFEEFAERLLLAMQAPDSHRLLTWLTGPPGSMLRPRLPAPPGAWIVCGYGRFGAQLVAAIERGGFDVVVVDPAGEDGKDAGGRRVVHGWGTDREILTRAGIASAAGIVAGTDDDTANLAIAITARRLNPAVFVIARQNLVANQPLFAALSANMTMVSSQIIANECVATLRTPHLAEFLEIVRQRDDAWAHGVVERLRAVTGQLTPEFWSISVTPDGAPGLADVMAHEATAVTVGRLAGVAAFGQGSDAVAMLLLRDDAVIELPADAMAIRLGDRILFAGTASTEREQREILRNANVARVVMTGRGSLGGLVWQWLGRRAR